MGDSPAGPAVPIPSSDGARPPARTLTIAAVLDVATAAFAVAAILALFFDNLRIAVGPLVVSATQPARVFTQAAALALTRLAVWPVPGVRGRAAFLLALTTLGGSLVAESTLRRVGDGHEYVAMAVQFTRLSPPSLTPQDIWEYERRLWPSDWGYDLSYPELRGEDGRQDLPHFWFYPLLAAVPVRLAVALGWHPAAGFTMLNGLLLLLAAAVLLRRLAPAAVLLLVASPVVWWLDKAHTEVFTFSLLAVALALLPARPWWTFVALGAASTQNPPLAGALALAFLVTMATPARGDRRTWIGATAGAALALLHPAYYLVHIGTWSSLSGSVLGRWPSWKQLTAVIADSNIGLVPNLPILAIITLAGLALVAWRVPRRPAGRDLVLAAALGALFLFSFAQTPNVNHGATPGPSRYVLWLVPLTIPLWRTLDGAAGRTWQVALGLAAALSMVASVVFFPPRVADRSLRPSALATALWTAWPSVENPLPEIFAERLSGREGEADLPIATDGCEKVLFAGDSLSRTWPAACPSVVVPPPMCRRPDALCYANRDGGGFAYVEVPHQSGFTWRRP